MNKGMDPLLSNKLPLIGVAGLLLVVPLIFPLTASADDAGLEVTSSPSTSSGSDTPTEAAPSIAPVEATALLGSPADTSPPTEPPTTVASLTSGTTTEPTPSTPAEAKVSLSNSTGATTTTYILALWEMLPNGDKFPQKLVTSTVTSSTDVHALDSSGTKCGTKYQSDLYAYDRITNALIVKGILNGGDESWPGGTYLPQFSNVFTTAKCGPTTITVAALEVLPPTCDAAGSLPLTSWPAAQNPNGFEGDGFRVYLNRAYTGAGAYVATVQKVGPGFDTRYPLGTKVTGLLSQTLTVLPAIGHQSTDANAPCYTAPPVVVPPVVVPPVVDPPVVTPPTVTPPAPLPVTPAADYTDHQLPTLASTGADNLATIIAVIAGAMFLGLGVGGILIARRRKTE